MKEGLLVVALLMTSSAVMAHGEAKSPKKKSMLDEVVVTSVREQLEQAGALKDVISKTEVIGSAAIEDKHASSLSEAIQSSPGVRVSNECSMCGVKRVLLNGMKGEHTTVLIDGLPTHTLISGFYGMDAIAMTGVERIEIARGAGASLIAPEAIGGVINIITKQATENGASLDISAGQNGFRQMGFLGTGISDDGSTRLTLIGQQDKREQVDNDNNGVSESPLLDNRSLTARISQDIGDRDNLVVRYSTISSEVFGGPMIGDVTHGISSTLASVGNGSSAQMFEDDDVRKRYIGQPWETTEWIDTQREEAALSWLHQFNDDWNMTLAASYADHAQDSFYEGFDYRANDKMLYLDARFNWVFNAAHLLTFGVDHRGEEMRSDTDAGSVNPNYVGDSFNYDVLGFYVQDAWRPLSAFEVSAAVRIDKVVANFIDPQKPGTEIDKTVVSPRVDIRYLHSEQWTSRLSVGRGYRAPLSFFESDHGILDAGDGFAIEVDQLERSKSANYALSFTGDRLTAAASIAWTEVEHLATLSETDSGTPLLSQLKDTATVIASDLALGYSLTDSLLANVTVEHFDYDEVMRSS